MGTIDPLEVRVVRLEDWRAEFTKSFDEVRGDLKDIKSLLNTLTGRIGALQACPHPGKCIELENRLRVLENDKHQMKGVLIMVGVCGTILGGILAAVWRRLIG